MTTDPRGIPSANDLAHPGGYIQLDTTRHLVTTRVPLSDWAGYIGTRLGREPIRMLRIEHFCTAPHLRGQGIGRQTLGRIEEAAEQAADEVDVVLADCVHWHLYRLLAGREGWVNPTHDVGMGLRATDLRRRAAWRRSMADATLRHRLLPVDPHAGMADLSAQEQGIRARVLKVYPVLMPDPGQVFEHEWHLHGDGYPGTAGHEHMVWFTSRGRAKLRATAPADGRPDPWALAYDPHL